MTSRTRTNHSTVAALLLLVSAALGAETKRDVRLDTATYVIRDFQALPESAIPEVLLRDATGIAIIPNVLKVGFGIGARFGRGVLALRDEAGRWRAPAFVTLGSGSFGWQIGAQSADLVLVFRDADRLRDIETSKFTLGADASIAAGPVGRYTSAATDVRLDAEVYSYSITRGLFAGIALDGAVFALDHDENARFYGAPGITLRQIAAIDPETLPSSARRMLEQLTDSAPAPAATIESDQSGAASPGGTRGVRTYGLGEEPLDPDPVAPSLEPDTG